MDEFKNMGMHAGAKPESFLKAKMLRNKMTVPEKKLWEALKQKQLGYKFRRQHPFGIYVLDFYCHRKRLCIEIDGKSHDNNIQKELDVERTKFIASYGVKVIRYKNEEVLNHIEKVTNEITELLREDTLQG